MKKRIYFIYKYTFPNGKTYIGQTYEGSGRYGTLFGYRNQLVYRAMKKYPNYEKEILEYCTLENVDERERFYIEKYKSMEKSRGYNREGGGNENKIRSRETKSLISSLHGGEPIVQYDLSGQVVKSWNYVSEAAEALGINPDQIYKCCRGKAKSAGGFLWAFRKEEKASHKTKRSKKVYQYSLSGDFVKEWNSVQEAADYYGIDRRLINACCNKDQKSAHGFQWSYEKVSRLNKWISNEPPVRTVQQLSLDNELVNEFDSISSAARYLGTTVTSIQNCLKGRTKTSNGYKWRYK